ncbi:MAG: methionine--tRNA ligase [Micavibrio sp.]|nr:methionine--tRNA ligase [Micavibrio sp.]
MADKQPFYLTTAIPYVNGVPHLGHAYEAILTDVMARFKRLDGYDVMFLTGSDEYGEKNAKKAEEQGITPQAIADENTAAFQEAIQLMGISNDDFIRTTEARHHKAAQEMWRRLNEKGLIYLDKYAGWYSVREESFFAEGELREDESGQKFTELGTEVEWVEEESYFFKLSEFTAPLLELYSTNPEFVQPSVRLNEIKAFVAQEGGLRDLSISRHKNRLEWGVPVPNDEDHVMYVWLDALTNYITGLGFPDMDDARFKKFWPCDYHVIGKDITRFHAIYWPAFLIAADIPLPKTIFAHGFINVNGAKMSKSVGNVLSPEELVKTYGQEPLRYLLMREVSHGQDGNFSHEHAVQRINSDLANGVGNLAQRTLSMIYKNCEGAIPAPNALNEKDKALLETAHNALYKGISDPDIVNQFKFNEVLMIIMNFVGECDRYVDEQAPWTLKKEDPERMKTVLYVLAEAIRCIAISMQFVTPGAAGKILDQLKVSDDERSFAHISVEYALKSGTSMDKPEGVFPRIVIEEAA